MGWEEGGEQVKDQDTLEPSSEDNPLGIGTLGIGTLGIGTLGIGTLGIGTLGIGTLGIGTLGNRRYPGG